LEVFSSDFEQNLAADEGEPNAELDEKLAQVREEFPLQVALLRFGRESEEIEIVRVFDDLLRKIGLRLRESGLEIGERLSLTAVEATVDLHDEDVAAPAILNGLLGIP